MNIRKIDISTRKLIIIFIFVILIVLILKFDNKNPKNDEIVIYFPPKDDFQSSNQGIVSIEVVFPEVDFKVGDKTADILMFVNSETVPGLKVLYNQKNKKFYAGIPLLITDQVTLLDGNNHKIEYSFNKDENYQSISLDGNLLAESEYTGDITVITGYSVLDQFNYEEMSIPNSINFE